MRTKIILLYMLMVCCPGASAQRVKTGSGKKLRTTGVILTAAGTSLACGGVAIIIKGKQDYQRLKEAHPENPPMNFSGVIWRDVFVCSAVLTGIGIPKWINGNKKERPGSRIQWGRVITDLPPLINFSGSSI